MTITATRFDLYPWQQAAVRAWENGWEGRRHLGTLEIVTGGGKTLIALSCVATLARTVPDLRVAVVVPTQALARQWIEALLTYTNLKRQDVGLMGSGARGALDDKVAIVAVLNSAAEKLPQLAERIQPLLLIVDECHRAGAPRFSRVLTTRSEYRLGLSATPDREEFDEDGEPLQYDEQVVGQALGGVVYRFTLKDARLAGWLPEFRLHHQGVSLIQDERRRYDQVSRRVDDAADALRGLGAEPSRARSLVRRGGDLGDAAASWIRLTSERKDLLYRAAERNRVAVDILKDEFSRAGDRLPRAILFHERVAEATELHEALTRELKGVKVALEHSRLPAKERRSALDAFRSGEAPVLVSVKSLVEGIDVPEADVGVSVASTSSVRQRIQSLGRILRRSRSDVERKVSSMHLVYVADSADELIYGKADWADLTGERANEYWLWPAGATEPDRAAGPPLEPRPTEDQAWQAIRVGRVALPCPWPGLYEGQEYTVSSTGVVHNSFGSLISNPQDVGDLVAAVRDRAGGRFRVTREHRLVLVWSADREPALFVTGQLTEVFVADAGDDAVPIDPATLAAGDAYLGTPDKSGGTFRVSRRGNGTIERRVRAGAESALTSGSTSPHQEANALRIVDAWDEIGRVISRFHVTADGIAWYEQDGGRRFLANVPEGFAWPSQTREEAG